MPSYIPSDIVLLTLLASPQVILQDQSHTHAISLNLHIFQAKKCFLSENSTPEFGTETFHVYTVAN